MSNRPWTPKQTEKLLDLSEARTPDAEIARRLRRTMHAVQIQRSRAYRRLGQPETMTKKGVADALGADVDRVIAWCRRGLLAHALPGGRGARLVSTGELEAFVRDERTWPHWSVERMPPGRWRDLAAEARAGVSLLTLKEAGRLTGYCPEQLRNRARRVGALLPGPTPGAGGVRFYLRSDRLHEVTA